MNSQRSSRGRRHGFPSDPQRVGGKYCQGRMGKLPWKESQLQNGTCREPLSASEQQQGHLTSASVEVELCAAATAELQDPLRGTQGG